MDEPKKSEEAPADGAKKARNPGDEPGGGGGDPNKRIAELEQENKELKAKVAELQKRLQELESERQAAAQKARASKLLARLEKQGMEFGADEEREKELQRLAGLSDEAFAATEATYALLAVQAKAEAKADNKPEPKGDTAAQTHVAPLRSDRSEERRVG